MSTVQDQPTPQYRSGVGMMLLNAQQQVFVGKRARHSRELAFQKENHSTYAPLCSDTADIWQMPQGGIDGDESPDKAILRELEEEIGTHQVQILSRTKDWLYYDLPDPLKGQLWGGRFVGQRQIWFLGQFTGSDQDINVHTAHPEFCDWRWVEPNALTQLVVSFKKDLYHQIMGVFAPFLSRGHFVL